MRGRCPARSSSWRISAVALLLVALAPVAASQAECKHHLKVSKANPPREAPAVSEHWELLPPGEKCSYHWDDGATLTYNKTLPWVETFTIPGGWSKESHDSGGYSDRRPAASRVRCLRGGYAACGF